jgi:hypothetical protein
MIAAEAGAGRDYSTAGLKEGQRIFAQAGLAPAGVGQAALQLGPEGPAMAADPGVDELMEDDVVGQVRRHHGQERVELDPAGARGAAPERTLAPDAQAAGAEAVLAGQGVQASGQDGPGGAPVEPFGRGDRLPAAVPGPVQPGPRPPDPGQLGQGQPPGFVKGRAPGDGDADAAGSPDGDRDMPGPPAPGEDDGPDAVELVDADRPGREPPGRDGAAVNPRNRTFSGPACC